MRGDAGRHVIQKRKQAGKRRGANSLGGLRKDWAERIRRTREKEQKEGMERENAI